MGLMARMFGSARGAPSTPPSYSNEAVIGRIEREEGVDRDTARAWFDEMLVFLDMCAASDQVLSPSKDVDKAWHAFLLHTRDYESYCRQRFGRTIHHQPGAPDPDAYRRAIHRRREYEGRSSYDPLIWPAATGAGGLPLKASGTMRKRATPVARPRPAAAPASAAVRSTPGGPAAGAAGSAAAPTEGAVPTAAARAAAEAAAAGAAAPDAAPLPTAGGLAGHELPNRLVLAPLAGIGNWFVRLQARRHGAGLVVSEMVSSFGLKHGNERTIREFLRIHPDEHPVSMQLFGHDADVMREAAAIVAERGRRRDRPEHGLPGPQGVQDGRRRRPAR